MYNKILLDNGIPLVTDMVPETRSVCIGIWVQVGSRHEAKNKNGISHFLEHMFFKGTKKRTLRDIAIEIDSLGGELNAFTSRESTTYYIKVLDEHLDSALDLLTDIFMNPIFPEEEIAKEKEIIYDEINLVEDSPEDYIHDLFNMSVWGESGLGQPVLGRKETIGSFKRNDLLRYTRHHYAPNSIILSCSGNFAGETLIKTLNRSIGTVRRTAKPGKRSSPRFHGGTRVITKDLSETHLCIGLQGLPQGSRDRYAMHLLNTILGAGVSSRLFLEIREKRGLAYSVGSFNVSYKDTGVWTVYTGTDRKHAGEVVKIITDQMRSLPTSLTNEELIKAKNQFKGNLVLALESTSSKMIHIAKQEMYYGEYYTPERIIREVESVSLEDIIDLAQRLAGEDPFALTVYGPVREKDLAKQGLLSLH